MIIAIVYFAHSNFVYQITRILFTRPKVVRQITNIGRFARSNFYQFTQIPYMARPEIVCEITRVCRFARLKVNRQIAQIARFSLCLILSVTLVGYLSSLV